jgi:hypothetical protein
LLEEFPAIGSSGIHEMFSGFNFSGLSMPVPFSFAMEAVKAIPG